MNLHAKIALQKLVYAMAVKKQSIARTFLSQVWQHIDPQPDYGTRTMMGKELTVFMKDSAVLYGGQYVKDSNGRNARIDF